MNTLKIEPTEFSPQVIFNHETSCFEISGESRPENTGKFYIPVIKWLEQYMQILYWEKSKFGKTKKVVFEFKFDYFNSTSAKYIRDIFLILNNYYLEGYELDIKWYYDSPDNDMKESGEEFAKLIKAPVMYVEKQPS
jgi:hypothetical protein